MKEATVDLMRTHLLKELGDVWDAEQQLLTALPRMARAAAAGSLRRTLKKHCSETCRHLKRLNQALRILGTRPACTASEGMKKLLAEGEAVLNTIPEGAVRDAVIITAARKVGHFEMASYATARTYANVLGESSVAALLDYTLSEEKAADLILAIIAETIVNPDAADEYIDGNQRTRVDVSRHHSPRSSLTASDPPGLTTRSPNALRARASKSRRGRGPGAGLRCLDRDP
jgi:ferritin-like metal-binding protein YciE